MLRRPACLWTVLLPLASWHAAATEALKNWFDDPFVQLTGDDRACPRPAGPFVTEKERLAQSHRRAEKGTTAWLAGEADRPKAYTYDQDIAAALQQAFSSGRRFAGSALWATVQGRVVYVEGCLQGDATTEQQLDAVVRAAPFVQQTILIVRTRPDQPVPYRVMPP